MSIPAYVKKIGLSILLLVASFNFVKTTLKVVDRSKRLDELQQDVVELEAERFELKNELEYKESEEFVVEEARNKLGMVKPDEELFVVSNVLGTESYSQDSKKHTNKASNAKLWFDLFFSSSL